MDEARNITLLLYIRAIVILPIHHRGVLLLETFLYQQIIIGLSFGFPAYRPVLCYSSGSCVCLSSDSLKTGPMDRAAGVGLFQRSLQQDGRVLHRPSSFDSQCIRIHIS